MTVDHLTSALLIFAVTVLALAVVPPLVGQAARWIRQERADRRREQWYIAREEAARKIAGRF